MYSICKLNIVIVNLKSFFFSCISVKKRVSKIIKVVMRKLRFVLKNEMIVNKNDTNVDGYKQN